MPGYEIQLVLGMLVVAAALVWIAGRVNIPYPVLLILGGAALSLVAPRSDPPLLTLRPDFVFILFLPPLIYFDGMLTSWRDFRANLRPILLLAVGLVIFTVFTLAAIAHWLIPALNWPSAIVLGAVISPTDAIAASAIVVKLNVPKRLVTILEAESLINDVTGLVAYNFAIAAVVTGHFSLPNATLQLAFVAVGGLAVGYVVARIFVWLMPRIENLGVETALSLLIPFIAYLPADWLHVSGVMSALAAGIYVGRKLPVVASPMSRLRLFSVWEAFVFILNAVCFMLIGLQLPGILHRLHDYSGWQLLYYALLVSLGAMAVRFLWVYPATYIPRMISPSLRRRDPAPSWRMIFFLGWTSMRGIVSLAAALAIPLVLSDGTTPFPGRDLIVFITFGVILFTLVVQGLSLPQVIRTLRLPEDNLHQREEQTARLETAHAAIARLEVLSFTNEELTDAINHVRETYLDRMRQLAILTGRLPSSMMQSDGNAARHDEVRRIALEAERRMLVNLRDKNMINDEVLRRVQTELDLEESRLGDGEETLSKLGG
jgi:monovalent cation/hydrogen antiporter